MTVCSLYRGVSVFHSNITYWHYLLPRRFWQHVLLTHLFSPTRLHSVMPRWPQWFTIVKISFCTCMLQVFVYTPPIYRNIKDRFKTRGISDLSNVELASYFSPWSAEHIGKIQAASGNATVEGWATEHLRINFYLFTYNSLLKLHENASLLRKVDSLLRNEALLQLNLRTLSPAFKDSVKREWFHEVIDNNLKLWEVNLWSRTLDLMPHDATVWEVPELMTTYRRVWMWSFKQYSGNNQFTLLARILF